MRASTVRVVTFSGIDGAGKSTQIQALQDQLLRRGFHAMVYSFWDDFVVLRRLREFMSYKAFRGDKGVGSPEEPINRKDKNVTAWYTTIARMFFYALDALSLRIALSNLSRGTADFIICDRYIYDELANLPLHRRFVQLYARVLGRFSPRPDVAYLVDAAPEAARVRKPEYPLEFLRRNRDAYLQLSQLVGGMIMIGPGSVEEMSSQVMIAISKECLRADPERRNVQRDALPLSGSAKTSNQ
jgi:thymidylate kinase